MKKNYFAPAAELVECETQSAILADSQLEQPGTATGGGLGGKVREQRNLWNDGWGSK